MGTTASRHSQIVGEQFLPGMTSETPIPAINSLGDGNQKVPDAGDPSFEFSDSLLDFDDLWLRIWHETPR